MNQFTSTGEKNHYLISVCEQENLFTFVDCLSWYNNKGVVPNLELFQQMLGFNHNKGIDRMKLGCFSQILQLLDFTGRLMHCFIPSQRETEIRRRRIAKITLMEHPLCLQGKPLWTRPLFVIQQAVAKQLLEMMPVSFLYTLCVIGCQLVCTQNRS